ncbi:MAG: chromate transporter [Armatimonas sp.]
MNYLSYFLLVLKASLLSTGGLGNVPSLHEDLVVSRGWVSERQFAESIAIGQTAPGPNGVWVISLGYLFGGLRGALLSVIAILLPAFFILVIERGYRRVKDHPAAEGFVRGLSLAVAGVFLTVMFRLLQQHGLELRNILVALASLALGASKRVPIIAILGLAAVTGLIFP